MRKLNVGCGKDIKKGWDNLDIVEGPGVDLVMDIQGELLCAPHNTYNLIRISHLIEHLSDPLTAMENLWWVAKPNCELQIIVPHGASDEAWEDQTHLRAYFPKSFLAFSQGYYWKADYGYCGDWEITSIGLEVHKIFKGQQHLDVIIERSRNVVQNMHVGMKAIKPMRKQKSKYLILPPVGITFV